MEGQCPDCGRRVQLMSSGEIDYHRWPRKSYLQCPGSYKKPALLYDDPEEISLLKTSETVGYNPNSSTP